MVPDGDRVTQMQNLIQHITTRRGWIRNSICSLKNIRYKQHRLLARCIVPDDQVGTQTVPISTNCSPYPKLAKKKHLQTVHKDLICSVCWCIGNNDNDVSVGCNAAFLHTMIFTLESFNPPRGHDAQSYHILNELSDALSAFPDVELNVGTPQLVMEMREGRRLNAERSIVSDEAEFKRLRYANISLVARDLEPQGISFDSHAILPKLAGKSRKLNALNEYHTKTKIYNLTNELVSNLASLESERYNTAYVFDEKNEVIPGYLTEYLWNIWREKCILTGRLINTSV